MLKKITYTLCFLILFVVVGNTMFFFNAQPPQGYTGAGGQYCTNCHSSFGLNSGGGSITATGLPTGTYAQGQAYNFSLTISHVAVRNKWGFSIAARNANGQPVGTFSDTNPNASPNFDELSHNNPVIVSSTSYTYNNLTWTAPSSPAAPDNQVTFYYVGNAANGDFGPGSDYIYSGSTIVALPITLSAFTADIKGTTVNLKWETSSESNSSHFIVEKSADNQHFYPLAKVNASGNSSSRKNYAFADDKPAYYEAATYYRLSLIDKDGSKKYSNVVTVSIKAIGTFVKNLYPNPARKGSNMYVEIISNRQQRISIQLIDINGHRVQHTASSLQKGNNIISVALNKTIAPGMYALLVQVGDGTQQIPVLIH